MATATATQASNSTASTDLVNVAQMGVVAGLVGGSVFGVQMAVTEMMPMIASMIGSESVVVGFILHMLISAFIGGTFGVIASRLPGNVLIQTVAGIGYGIVWWVLGALIIMPLVLGMGEMVLQIGDMQWMSFIGHAMFGVVMAVVFVLLRDKQQ